VAPTRTVVRGADSRRRPWGGMLRERSSISGGHVIGPLLVGTLLLSACAPTGVTATPALLVSSALPGSHVLADYFVSITGTHSNDGRSPSTAWRTFAHVSAGAVPTGSVIAAEAGGVWNESVQVHADNLSFGVYGVGPRPTVIAPDGQYAFDSNWSSGMRIEGWEFTSATRRGGPDGIVRVAGHDYVVRDIVVHGADDFMFTARGLRGLVEHSEFYDNDGSGPTVSVSIGGHEGPNHPPPSDVTIFRSNVIRDTQYRALANWGSNVLLENNRIERWSGIGVDGSDTQAPAGIYVTSRYLGGVTVRGNTLLGTGVEHQAIWVDTGPEHQTIVEGNTVVNALRCFWAEKTDNVIFRNNTCDRIEIRGLAWGSGADHNHDLATNGQIVGNTLIGPEPFEGWIVLYPGSSAAIGSNTYIP
jgi:hypothetical protein